MKRRGLIIGWTVTVLSVLLALGWAGVRSVSLAKSDASAKREHAALSAQLGATHQKIQAELRAKAEFLKDIRWRSEQQTGADVLRRLAALARDGHAKVSAVAPVEKDAAGGRSRESSHRVEMTGSFHEILDFAMKVEREGILLEDVVIESGRTKPGAETPPGVLQAQFRLTTIEPSDDVRKVIRRFLTATATNASSVQPTALTLPVAVREAPTSTLRDPFTFAEPPRPRARVPRNALAAAPSPVVAQSPAPIVLPMTVKGIVTFAGGPVAIVNDQIVKVGDMVDGHRVQEIADGRVVLDEPGGGSRSVSLAGFAPIPPARLMRK